MSVTDLTTTQAALSLGLTCAERREVVVEQETLVVLIQHVIYHLLIILGTQCNRAQSLCLTTGEY